MIEYAYLLGETVIRTEGDCSSNKNQEVDGRGGGEAE